MRASARSSDYCRRCRPSEDGTPTDTRKAAAKLKRIVAQASTLALTVDGRDCESRYTVHPELRAAAPAVVVVVTAPISSADADLGVIELRDIMGENAGGG